MPPHTLRTIPTIRRADKKDWPLLTEILADAFTEDPVLRWMSKHPAFPEYSYSVSLPGFEKVGGMLMDDQGLAACLYVKPGYEMHNPVSARVIARGLLRFGPGPLLRSLRFLNTIAQHHHTPAHTYVFAIGARRQAHGCGLGSAVMKYFLTSVADPDLPVYLENSNPANTAFYRKFGFEPQKAFRPGNGPQLVGMLRPAESQTALCNEGRG